MAPPPPPPLIPPHLHQQSRNGPLPPRHPPAYIVATQKARSHRLGRAHSYEGVTSASFISPTLPMPTGSSSIVQPVDIDSIDVDCNYHFNFNTITFFLQLLFNNSYSYEIYYSIFFNR